MNSEEHISKSDCSVCNSARVTAFLEILGAPVHCNLLYATREEALTAPRGDIRLQHCADCGHVFNSAFDPERMLYAGDYENSLHFSPRFQSYAEELALRLIERHDLRGKRVIEIGCGRGDFLKLLCDLGDNIGVGFDPGYRPDANDDDGEGRVTFIRGSYSERYSNMRADLVCCRHMLEHIENPTVFLTELRRIAGDDTAVFFEVPNATYIWRDLAVWDIIYEHCSYFSSRSLARVFAAGGFDVSNIGEAFEGQFLCIEASPGDLQTASPFEDNDGLEDTAALVATFADRYKDKLKEWQMILDRLKNTGQRAALWGAGSKGVTFLNAVRQSDQIACVIDINPRKHGMHIAGTGQRIAPPESLRDHSPDVVIVMNRIYETEIRRMTERLGLKVEVISV